MGHSRITHGLKSRMESDFGGNVSESTVNNLQEMQLQVLVLLKDITHHLIKHSSINERHFSK